MGSWYLEELVGDLIQFVEELDIQLVVVLLVDV